MWQADVFSIGIALVDVLWNWLNWFYFLLFEVGLLVFVIDCMISVTVPRFYKDVYVKRFFSSHS